MNAEILKTFLDEAQSSVPLMREGIAVYEREGAESASELQTVRRHAHAIKGAASSCGQTEISEIAGEIESGLKPIISHKSPLSEAQTNELLSRILVLQSHLNDLRKQVETEGSEQISDSWGEAKDNTNTKTSASVPDFEIDAEMLEIFAAEAEDLLSNIRINLSILQTSPDNHSALLEIRRSSHTLKGSAGIIGLLKLSSLAHRVEDLLDFLSENNIGGNREIFEILQTAFDCLSSLAAGDDSVSLNRKIEHFYSNFDQLWSRLQADHAHPFPQENLPHEHQNNISQLVDLTVTVDEQQIETNLETPQTITILPSNAAASPTTHSIAAASRPATRVSLDRLNDLFNLAGEMVVTRSVFEQRLNDLEQQIREMRCATQRLRSSTDKLEIEFEAGAPVASSGAIGTADIFQSFSSASGFDDLEFDRYTEFHQITRELTEVASDTLSIKNGLDNLFDNLSSLFDNQRRLIEGMQGNLLRLRMISFGSLAPRLQRTVQVTAKGEEKEVELIIENEGLEIDAEILDAVVEPLLHLLRNAVAHGIETPETRLATGKSEKGIIRLQAYSEGTHVVFSITDDGRGISVTDLKKKAVLAGFVSAAEAEAMSDEEAFSLVFLPGLSTAQEINQVSGRGVGMNVVKTNITRRNGTIAIQSEAGHGAIFTIRLPVSLAVTRSLLASSGGQAFAFSLHQVKQFAEIYAEDFQNSLTSKIIVLNGISYSFYHLNELLGSPVQSAAEDVPVQVLIIKTPETTCALAVERVLKTEELVIKPLGSMFKNLPQFNGAAILGDGAVVPVVDLSWLIKKEFEKRKRGVDADLLKQASQKISQPAKESGEFSVLIVDDSPSVRLINSNLMKSAGWSPVSGKDGLDALEVLQEIISGSKKLPNIILTDVEMPRMDGFELLATLKRQPSLKHIPVIMITSRSGEKHHRRAVELGVDEYLTKPYEAATLIAKIKSLTDQK